MPAIKRRGFPQEDAKPLTLREIKVKYGLPSPEAIHEEIQEMFDVLLDRVKPPIDCGITTLMEISDAYFGRASELEFLILEGERLGDIPKDSDYVKMRTGALRTLLAAAKKHTETGSRRLTAAQLEFDALRRGMDTEGAE